MEWQLNIVRVARLLIFLFLYLGKEVMPLEETVLEILREILKGVLRETSAYLFRKNILDNEKTTPRRRKQKGGSHK
jgi:hypothetical protein